MMKADQARAIIIDEAAKSGWTLVYSDMRRGAFRLRSADGVVRLNEGGSPFHRDIESTVRHAVYCTIESGKRLRHLEA
jgi:hypothetical protein